VAAFGQLLAKVFSEADRGLVIRPAKHPRADEVVRRT
jgi:hypothetical protein